MEKICDLIFFFDVLFIVFYGFVGLDWLVVLVYVVGENILIFGVGLVGRVGVVCVRFLGVGVIIVVDYI